MTITIGLEELDEAFQQLCEAAIRGVDFTFWENSVPVLQLERIELVEQAGSIGTTEE